MGNFPFGTVTFQPQDTGNLVPIMQSFSVCLIYSTSTIVSGHDRLWAGGDIPVEYRLHGP